MRLWHYKLVRFLPNSQLIAQWRELNSIFKSGKGGINHILINYVKEYENVNLLYYCVFVTHEMNERGIHFQIKAFNEFFTHEDFQKAIFFNEGDNPFPNHHTERYLLQCFYNLQEKYDRGQKDFTEEQYEKLEEFVKHEMQH